MIAARRWPVRSHVSAYILSMFRKTVASSTTFNAVTRDAPRSTVAPISASKAVWE